MRRKQKTERIDARVEKEVYEWATAEAEKQRCTVSEVVRKALELLRQVSQGPAAKAWVTVVVLTPAILTYILMDLLDNGVIDSSIHYLTRVF